MAENEEGFVSVVGAALIQPIFDLVEKLESMKPVLPNEVKTGQHENGYSLATIVLSVIVFESALNRNRLHSRRKTRRTGLFQRNSCRQRSRRPSRGDFCRAKRDRSQSSLGSKNNVVRRHAFEICRATGAS
jgi:hypothetical protein